MPQPQRHSPEQPFEGLLGATGDGGGQTELAGLVLSEMGRWRRWADAVATRRAAVVLTPTGLRARIRYGQGAVARGRWDRTAQRDRSSGVA
ncbi:MAG: hypothetical protein ACRDZW_07395 [Acidimicrobiales bacterium]